MLKKLISLILVCSMAIPLFSCETKLKEPTVENQPEKFAVQMNLADYTVVYGDLANDATQTCANRIRNKMRTVYAMDIPAVAESASNSEKEILVGTTARSQSEAAIADV